MTTLDPITRNRQITRAFKHRGLSLQSSALDAVINVLRRESSETYQSTLQNIIDEVKDKLMKSNQSACHQLIVTQRLLSEVVAEMSRDADDVMKEALQYLDAFETPKLEYDSMKKTFLLGSPEGLTMLGEAEDKVEMLLQRYWLVHQRILRQEIFQPKLVTADGGHLGAQRHKISNLESLLGETGVRFLLGMIVQVEEGVYYLEDHTAQVPIDISHSSVLTDGFITENCIVLVEGEVIDGTLYIHHLGNPIYEDRVAAVNAIGLQNSDIFNAMPSLSELSKMREQEIEHGEEGMFVILSDVYLDNPYVLSKLETLFSGFMDLDPLPVFVLMGNFCSRPLTMSNNGTRDLIGHFDDLAHIIAKFPKIAEHGKIIFVPGPNDPGLGKVMPRPPISNYFTRFLRKKVKHAIFASNPCRIRYFSKELVFCRQDIVHKLRRNKLISPRKEDPDDSASNDQSNEKDNDQTNSVESPPHSTTDTTDTSDNTSKNFVKHAVKTMLDQGHLCPLPLMSCPIYWQYDHVLRLYPPPDALLMGDCIDQYYENYRECDAINPGPFSVDGSFVVYRPVGDVSSVQDVSKSDVEFSQID